MTWSLTEGIWVDHFLEAGSNLEEFVSRGKLCGADLPEEDSWQRHLLKFQPHTLSEAVSDLRLRQLDPSSVPPLLHVSAADKVYVYISVYTYVCTCIYVCPCVYISMSPPVSSSLYRCNTGDIALPSQSFKIVIIFSN